MSDPSVLEQNCEEEAKQGGAQDTTLLNATGDIEGS